MLAVLNAGDKILGFDLSHGGHLTHGSSVNFSGKLYEPHFYGVVKETGLIDYEQLERVALEQNQNWSSVVHQHTHAIGIMLLSAALQIKLALWYWQIFRTRQV